MAQKSVQLTILYATLLYLGAVTCSVGAESGCERSVEDIEQALEEALEDDFSTTINCMAFDRDGIFVSAAVSGRSNNVNVSDVRYFFTCANGVVVGVQSSQGPIDVESGVCVTCEDTPSPCSDRELSCGLISRL